jgi:small subunit ribosomal protein S3
MGQKVNPNGMRVGIIKNWKSNWYANKKTYTDTFLADLEVRRLLEEKLAQASISSIEIERPKNANILVRAARPGAVIKKGSELEELREKASKIMGVPVHIKIEEVRKPELDARLVAENVAQQLERRIMFRRAMKRAVSNALRLGAEGIKICVSGRLGGADIARSEWYREGRVPLHTFRADIDYAVAEAKTTYGMIGVKVWIFKGEILGRVGEKHAQEEATNP